MTTERNHGGIRLAYVHLSVTTPRVSGPREVLAETTPLVRGAEHRQRDRIPGTGSADRARGLAA